MSEKSSPKSTASSECEAIANEAAALAHFTR